MHHKNHLKYMLIAGGGIAAVLLATGVRPGQALLTAAALACPLMMVGMMFFMSRSGRGHISDQNAYPAEAPVGVPGARNNHEEIS